MSLENLDSPDVPIFNSEDWDEPDNPDLEKNVCCSILNATLIDENDHDNNKAKEQMLTYLECNNLDLPLPEDWEDEPPFVDEKNGCCSFLNAELIAETDHDSNEAKKQMLTYLECNKIPEFFTLPEVFT